MKVSDSHCCCEHRWLASSRPSSAPPRPRKRQPTSSAPPWPSWQRCPPSTSSCGQSWDGLPRGLSSTRWRWSAQRGRSVVLLVSLNVMSGPRSPCQNLEAYDVMLQLPLQLQLLLRCCQLSHRLSYRCFSHRLCYCCSGLPDCCMLAPEQLCCHTTCCCWYQFVPPTLRYPQREDYSVTHPVPFL